MSNRALCSVIEHYSCRRIAETFIWTLVLTDEYRYRILKLLQHDPRASQRKIANTLGISLGRVNFCVQALIEKGLIKASNFRSNPNKAAYLYYLTPKGLEEKTKVTLRFFKHKLTEYEALKRELDELKGEAAILNIKQPLSEASKAMSRESTKKGARRDNAD